MGDINTARGRMVGVKQCRPPCKKERGEQREPMHALRSHLESLLSTALRPVNKPDVSCTPGVLGQAHPLHLRPAQTGKATWSRISVIPGHGQGWPSVAMNVTPLPIFPPQTTFSLTPQRFSLMFWGAMRKSLQAALTITHSEKPTAQCTSMCTGPHEQAHTCTCTTVTKAF